MDNNYWRMSKIYKTNYSNVVKGGRQQKERKNAILTSFRRPNGLWDKSWLPIVKQKVFKRFMIMILMQAIEWFRKKNISMSTRGQIFPMRQIKISNRGEFITSISKQIWESERDYSPLKDYGVDSSAKEVKPLGTRSKLDARLINLMKMLFDLETYR